MKVLAIALFIGLSCIACKKNQPREAQKTFQNDVIVEDSSASGAPVTPGSDSLLHGGTPVYNTDSARTK